MFRAAFITSKSVTASPAAHGKPSFPKCICKAGDLDPSQGKNTRHGPSANSGTFMGMREPWCHQVKPKQAVALEGMVKSSPGEGSAAQEPNPSSAPTGTWQADARSQPAFSYQLMKSTLGQTSASRALQVLQISDLSNTRHSIYSLGLMSLPRM